MDSFNLLKCSTVGRKNTMIAPYVSDWWLLSHDTTTVLHMDNWVIQLQRWQVYHWGGWVIWSSQLLPVLWTSGLFTPSQGVKPSDKRTDKLTVFGKTEAFIKIFLKCGQNSNKQCEGHEATFVSNSPMRDDWPFVPFCCEFSLILMFSLVSQDIDTLQFCNVLVLVSVVFWVQLCMHKNHINSFLYCSKTISCFTWKH